jgi:hypothetical protein
MRSAQSGTSANERSDEQSSPKTSPTLRTVKLCDRRPITTETVKELLRKDLPDVARVALKYSDAK